MKSLRLVTDNSIVLSHPSINDCLIFDLETNSLDVETAKIKFFGFYSYKYMKYFILRDSESELAQRLISEHKVLVGFNCKSFDIPILENNGFDVQYKIVFDCMRVLYNPDIRKTNRKVIIELANGNSLESECSSNSLRSVCEALGFETSKGEIDYRLFKQDSWSEEELKQIESYLFKDLDCTRRLFEFYVEYFDNFKAYVNMDNIRKFNYIRSSLGSYTYSAICHLAGLEEVYGEGKSPSYKGADVLEIEERYAEDVIAFDFSSLYPHNYIQCNLISHDCDCCLPEEKWPFNNFFEGVKGKYCSKKMGAVESILRGILIQRLAYKKAKDPRQLPYKIMLNTFYGLTGNVIFKNFYTLNCASDCTAIGRKCIKYTQQRFNELGFKVLYGDTDSCFVKLCGKTKEEAVEVANKIVLEIQSNMLFSQDTWKLSVDNEIGKVWFFGKKNYVFITKEGKLKIKGLPIIKSDASELGQLILKELKPRMLAEKNIKFDRFEIEKLIQDKVNEDITLIGQLYNVRSPEDYSSKNSLHYQIASSTKFGEGSHLLIPNKKLGDVGKKKKYCSVEEAKQLTVADLLLDKVWSELEPFIQE